MRWVCSLNCWFTIEEDDPDIDARKRQHESLHTNCRVQKRNNTEGEVKWVLK